MHRLEFGNYSIAELSREQIINVCILQARLTEVLLVEFQQMLNAMEGANPESAEMIAQWAARINERTKGAYADIQAVMRSGPPAAPTVN